MRVQDDFSWQYPQSIPVTVSIENLPQTSRFDDSYTQLVTISAPLPKREWDCSITDLKEPLMAINNRMEDMWQHITRTDYDCTGQHFTTGFDRKARFISGDYIHAIYVHRISLDV